MKLQSRNSEKLNKLIKNIIYPSCISDKSEHIMDSVTGDQIVLPERNYSWPSLFVSSASSALINHGWKILFCAERT